MGVAFPEQRIHFAQRVFAAATRAKAVTASSNSRSKIGSITNLSAVCTMRSLTTGIPNGRILPPPLGISTRRIGSGRYSPAPKRLLQFFQIHFCPCRKPLHALPIHSRRSGVRLYLLPRRLKRLASVHFVDQAKPFPSFDAVFQRRQHALVPHRGFHPRPVSALGLCALCSPLRHSRRLAFALPRLCRSRFYLPASRPSAQLCFLRFSRLFAAAVP